ncbi:MAG: hypothetical protein B6U97_04820 [Candidatus Altiarchaeales archaeon ex4484_96]|nr:MAG: hypothetical protein B6U97_04820 [Candidatus Altiarchaeales archaeon ex4484_96]
MVKATLKTDLVVFGDTAIDHFYEVVDLPKKNHAADVLNFHSFYGGMGANTAVVANSLGIDTALVSVIGTDAEDYRNYMKNLGIKLYLKGIFGDTTKSMFFKKAENQISFFYKGVTDKLNELDFDGDIIKAAKCIYLARTYLNLQKRVARECKNRFLVYNPGYGVFKFTKIPSAFKQVLKQCNVLVLNHHELAHLSSIDFKLDFKLGPKVFLITQGDKGATVYFKGAQINVPTYKTKAVDPSGAGDAFNAGFIAAHLEGLDIYESVKLANATASFIVEQWGCQTNLPTWADVLHRYKKI